MKLSDFNLVNNKGRASTTKTLEQFTPEIEERTIELLNSGLARSDVSRILVKEFNINLASRPGTSADYRGLNTIYEKLLEQGKLDSSITEINKEMTGKYLTGPEMAAQDEQILDLYLANESKFKQKPASQLAKLFNQEYGLKSGTNAIKGTAIAPRTVKRAFENAINGKYKKFDELFKGRELSDFILSKHAKIFPEVKKLDQAIKEGIKEGYLLEDTGDGRYSDRKGTYQALDRLKKSYAKKIGMSITDPKLENNFISRIRKILNSYSGNNVERYEKELYNSIKPPTSNYIDSVLHKNLISIGAQAGKLSNKDMALALGLPKKDAELLSQLSQGSHSIARKYNLPLVEKGGVKLYMAGDHTDIKGLMQNFPEYKKNFMRIAFIQDGLNTLKASYDSKILALKRAAEQGLTFDKGIKSSDQIYKIAYDKKTNKPIGRGVKFDSKKHIFKKTGITKGGYNKDPFSGPLTAAEKQAGGRTIPEAVNKLQKDFYKLSGGYKLGGFNIENGKIIPQNYIQPRINERTSPVSQSLRETLNNIRFSEPGGKRITDAYLNVVDKAILGPEGATTKGRIDIIKKFKPKDLKASAFLEGLRTSTPFGDKTSPKQITQIMNKGLQAAIDAADVNENNVCSIFGMKRGGLAGGGCGDKMRQALQETPEQTLNQVSEVATPKVKSLVQNALKILPRMGTVGKIGTVAAGAGIALSGLRFNSEKGEIVTTDNDQKADQNQILQYVKDNPLKVTAGSSLGFAAQEVPGAYKAARDLGRGRVRSTLGISGAIRPVLTTFGTPLLTGLYEGAIGAKRLDEGETMTDILTDPVGPALGLTLMEPLSKLSGVVRDAPKRTMLEGARNYFNLSNVGQARPGLTGQILRMGLSPRMIAGASRFLGLPGIALGAGLAGYDAYKNYQNQEGMIYNLFNKDG